MIELFLNYCARSFLIKNINVDVIIWFTEWNNIWMIVRRQISIHCIMHSSFKVLDSSFEGELLSITYNREHCRVCQHIIDCDRYVWVSFDRALPLTLFPSNALISAFPRQFLRDVKKHIPFKHIRIRVCMYWSIYARVYGCTSCSHAYVYLFLFSGNRSIW